MSEPTATPVVETGDTTPPPVKRSRKRAFLIAAGTLPLALVGLAAARLGASGETEEAAPARTRTRPGVLALEPFVVNLGADTGRFLKCAVRIALASAEEAERIQGEPLTLLRVQDGLLSVLSCASAESLAEPGGKQALRGALLRRAREALPEIAVEDVYFQEFLFQ